MCRLPSACRSIVRAVCWHSRQTWSDARAGVLQQSVCDVTADPPLCKGAPALYSVRRQCVPCCVMSLCRTHDRGPQVCVEEVLEEVGFSLRPEQLTRCAGALVSSAGITGSRQSVFFAQVRLCGRAGCVQGWLCTTSDLFAHAQCKTHHQLVVAATDHVCCH